LEIGQIFDCIGQYGDHSASIGEGKNFGQMGRI